MLYASLIQSPASHTGHTLLLYPGRSSPHGQAHHYAIDVESKTEAIRTANRIITKVKRSQTEKVFRRYHAADGSIVGGDRGSESWNDHVYQAARRSAATIAREGGRETIDEYRHRQVEAPSLELGPRLLQTQSLSQSPRSRAPTKYTVFVRGPYRPETMSRHLGAGSIHYDHEAGGWMKWSRAEALVLAKKYASGALSYPDLDLKGVYIQDEYGNRTIVKGKKYIESGGS